MSWKWEIREKSLKCVESGFFYWLSYMMLLTDSDIFFFIFLFNEYKANMLIVLRDFFGWSLSAFNTVVTLFLNSIFNSFVRTLKILEVWRWIIVDTCLASIYHSSPKKIIEFEWPYLAYGEETKLTLENVEKSCMSQQENSFNFSL